MAIENFGVGTLIIPMDATYQNLGMYRAYGLVYNLLSNGIPVKWVIQSGKAFNGTDFTASATDFQSGTIITNHNYSGGPYIIDSAFAAAAAPFITAWQVANPNVKVHVATAPFSADIAATMQRAPRIAVEASNSGIVTTYLNAAGIRDSIGDVWSSASPGVLSESEIAAGALFGYDLTACRRNAYDILISPHTGTGVWDDPGLKLELNDWLYQGGFLHAMCASIPSIENEAGPFLTQSGIPETDTNKGDTGTFTVDIPDFPTVQAVNTTAPQGLPGGSFQTIYHNTPGLVYNPQTQILAHFIQTSTGKQYDFIMAGPYKNGAGAGKVVYEGGHQYSNSLPYTGNMENMYTRFVLDDVFFAVGKPLMYLEFNTGNPNNQLFVGQPNTITFKVVNEGASPALSTGFSVTLIPGMTYNNDATIPPTSVVGQTLSWSPAALGNVPPGTVLTFTSNYTPPGVGTTQLATFSTSFGDENNENYNLNNICVKTTVVTQERPILDVVKTVDKDFATYGDTLTYTVTITNNGNVTATNVVFVDPIPAGTTFVPNSVTVAVPPGLPVPVPGADPSVGVPLPNIPPAPAPGSTVVVTFQVTVNSMVTPQDVINQAFVNFQYTVDGTPFSDTAQSNVVTTVIRIGQLTLVKSTDKTVAAVGDIITYTVDVTNTGNTVDFNTTFFDNPPAGTNFIPGTVFVNGVNQPGANPIAGIPLGDLPVSTPDSPNVTTVSFQVEVTSIPVPPTLTNTANATFLWRVNPADQPSIPGSGTSNPVITQLVAPELTVVKSADKTAADLGETITYTVTVTNTGDVTAQAVVLTDPVPAGTTFVPDSVTVGGFPAPGADPNVGIPLGNIPPGGSVTVTFQVTATSIPVPNPTTNIATATGLFTIEPGEPPRQLSFDSNPVDVQIENAVLTAVKSVDKAFAEVGDTLTYTVVVTNTGTIVANNVVFMDNPPNGTSFVPGSVTVNGLPVPGDPSLGIPLGNIPPGGAVTVTFQVHVDAIPVPNPTVNFGTIDADFPVNPQSPIHKTFETNPVSTRVEIAQVDVVKNVDKAFAEVGDILTYTVTMTNVGTVPANSPVFTDIVPNGTTFVPLSVTVNGVPTPGDPSLGIPLPNIPVGCSVTVTFQAQVTSTPVPNPAVNIGTLSAQFPVNPQSPITKEFPSNPVTTQVETAGVNVVKTVDKAFAELGDVLTYTTTITNPGTVPATNVVFTDVTPNGINFVPGTVTVNGLPTPGNPAVGIPLADIPVGGSIIVSFQATVDTIPVPNPAENISVINALYPVNPQSPTPKTTESNPAPTQVVIATLDIVKSADRQFAEVGDTITFTSVITNTGTLPATNVVFNDIVPNGLAFVPGSVTINGLPSAGNPNVGIPLPNIPVGGSVTVAFDVTVTSIPVPNPTTNISSVGARFQIDPTQPSVLRTFVSNPVDIKVETATVDVVKSVDKAFVEVGDIVTYTVVMTNTGTVPANNAELTDIVPNGTTFVPGSVTINGIPSGSNPGTGIPVGNIPVGGFATVTFQVQVTSLPVPNPTNNMASIEAAFPVDPNRPPVIKNFDSNVVQFQVEIAEVTAVKTADKQFVEVGDTVTYTVVVTNTGTVTAQNVNFVDTIPPETSFVPNSVVVDGIPQPGANPLTGISLGNILPGGSKTVTFVVTVDSLPPTQIITNNALVQFDVRIDPNGPLLPRETPSNPVDTQVEIADISVVKSADKEFVEVGDTLTYTVVVTNTGTVTVDNVIFKDSPPVSTTFIPGSFRLNGVLQPGADPNVGVNIGSVPPGGSKTVSFRATVDILPPGGQITNTATVDFEFRINPAGPTQTRTKPSNPVVTEVELVQLQVIKDVDKTVAVVGDTLTYTVSIANTGTVTAMDVVFTDEIPNGTSFVENSVLVNGVAQPGANPEAGITIGDIPPGGFATVVFSVVVEERPEPPEVVNVAVIDFKVQINPEGPIEERTEESEPVVTRIEIVELTAVKTADKSAVKVGDTLTYTVAITNTSTLPVENVIFKDQIPEGTKLVANSVTVNGVVQPGANPSIGVPIGTIQPGQTVIVKFSVTIEFAPCPPELINMAVITFDFRLEPTGPVLSGSTTSNETLTDVGLRIFKQFSVDENLTIPVQKPDVETLLDVMAHVEITSTTIIKTPVVTSFEGQRLTGWKMIVEGKLIQKITYIADVPRQSVHAAHFEVPFSTFLVLPADFNQCQKIRVVGYVEDVFSKLLDPRTIFKNVTLRVEGIINCS